MNIARQTFGLVLLSAAVSCGGTDVTNFSYGGGQPGVALAEGGEIRHENVRLLGMPAQTWLMVYQYAGPAVSATAPFVGPDNIAKYNGATHEFGNCADERTSATWPFTPITGATYLNLSTVAVTGPGITGTLNVIKTNPPNTGGNSNFRKFDFTYGGGAPGDQAGFNASMTTAAMSTPGGAYTLDIGKTGVLGTGDTGTLMTYNMPDAYTAPLGIGAQMTVNVPAGQDLEMTWTPPANDFGADGKTHNKKTHFNATFFADPTAANPPLFLCFPDVEGHQLVPAAVINALPAGGLIVNFDISHYMEARDAGETAQRRFDLVTIYCNISLFSKQ